MIQATQLENWCNALLTSSEINDYAPNGLQVEGSRPIEKLATGVTANRALIEVALDWRADALLVHHGYFWSSEPLQITGMKAKRIALLMKNDVSLLTYHLPLDLHTRLGNNAQFAKTLQFNNAKASEGDPLLWYADLDNALSPVELAQRIEKALMREPLHISAQQQRLKRIAWCTGAAQKLIDAAADIGADAFISGEISEATTHIAHERNIHYYAAGHHATERYGVQALGEAIASEFEIKHHFFDIDNPA